MKTKKRFLGILLSLALVLGLVPGMSLTAYAETSIPSNGSATENGLYYYVGFSLTGNVTGWAHDQQYSNVFDGNGNTKNCGKLDSTGATIEFQANQAFVPKEYYIRTADGVGSGGDFVGRNLKSWTISAKKEASDEWDQIASVTNDTTMQTESYTAYKFDFDNPNNKVYKYFKLCVSEKRGASGKDNDNLEISEFYMAGNIVFLNKSTTTLNVGSTEKLTATFAPNDTTDKKVQWSVGGTNADAVKLYSDENCTTEVGTAATETLTVYAKGISEGSATVTAISNADSTKSATCAVTVNAVVASVTSGGTTTNYTDFAGALTAWNTAGAGATLKLLADVETSSGINVNKGYGNPMILDLNGYGIRYAGSGSAYNCSVIYVGDSGSLKLIDGEPTRVHYITLDSTGRGTAVSDTISAGAIEVTGGYLTGGIGYGESSRQGAGVYTFGSFTMEGGTIVGNTVSSGSDNRQGGGVYIAGTGTFNMNGGTITANAVKGGNGGDSSGGGVYVNVGSTQVITSEMDEAAFLRSQIVEIRRRKDGLYAERAEHANTEVQIRLLLELVDEMVKNSLPEWMARETQPVGEETGACRDYDDFFSRTRYTVPQGVLDENGRMENFNNDLVIRYLDRVVVKDDGYEVAFKAGVTVEVEI